MSIEQPRQTWLLRFAAVLAVALGGAVLAHFSMAAHPRFLHLPWSVDSQKAILERRVFVFEGIESEFPTWRHRIMVPLAMRAISATTGASDSQAYLLVRWASACAALAAFAWLVRTVTRANWWLSGGAALALAFSLFPTFLHIYEVPSDFLDAAFFSVLLGCVLLKRSWAFATVLLIALLNRESAIFAVGAWWAVQALPFDQRTFWRETIFAAALGVAGTGLVAAIRVANSVNTAGANAGLQQFEPGMILGINWRQIADFLAHPNYGNPLFYLAGYLLLVALVAAASWDRLPPALRRLGWVAVAMYAISLPFGCINELRINIPALVISTLLLAALAFRPAEAAPVP